LDVVLLAVDAAIKAELNQSNLKVADAVVDAAVCAGRSRYAGAGCIFRW
jgi:hypothetical protein